MSKLNITPGPWFAAGCHEGYEICTSQSIFDDDMVWIDNKITRIATVEGVTGTQENDARLIADAGTTANKCGLLPSELLAQRDELLGALRGLAEIVESYEYGRPWPGRPHAQMDAARAAIAKVKGQA